MPEKPQRRERVDYKKPSKLNAVSVSLVLMLALLVWIGSCLYPGFMLKTKVKEELRLNLLTLYQANLRGGAEGKRDIYKLRNDLQEKLRKLGVTDNELKVHVEHGGKTVALEAHFSTVVLFTGINKRWIWKHSPRVETSAERVDW